ncbi:hypothetical protein V5O48_018479 [Marasmius crinis-equi]|uniref:Uncharacterized protein n=1 Tax=Marasmius crinis-equi TaxID=585013 RepID=A0ABR3EL55_9AGAR
MHGPAKGHQPYTTRGKFWVVKGECRQVGGSRGFERFRFPSVLWTSKHRIPPLRDILLLPLRGLQRGLQLIRWIGGIGTGGGVRGQTGVYGWIFGWMGTTSWPMRWMESIGRRLWIFGGLFGRGSGHNVYRSDEEEERYWDSAKKFRRRLQSSDARFQEAARNSRRHPSAARMTQREVYDSFERRVPVVTSYQPALPPESSRRSRNGGNDGIVDKSEEYPLSTKAFCKWYRMVHPPGSVCVVKLSAAVAMLIPSATRKRRMMTASRASKLKRYYSSRDRREMRRIARLLPNEVVFDARWKWIPMYRDMWMRWLERKGPDICVVFEK